MRDVAIVSQFAEASSSLTGEDYTEFIEVVETFKFLGRMLNRSYYDCRSVLLNVGKAHQVCSRLGKLLRIGGIPESVSNVILGSGAGSATLWGRDLGFIIGNVHLYGGCECGFPQTVDGEECRESEGKDLEKCGIGKGNWGSGYSDTWAVYWKEAGNSGVVGGVEADTEFMRQVDGL